MLAFIRTDRFCLRNKVSSILSIIICPAMNCRYFTLPVPVTGTDRCRPFEGIRSPWILAVLSSLENRVEEIKYKQELHCKDNDRNDRNQLIKLMESR